MKTQSSCIKDLKEYWLLVDKKSWFYLQESRILHVYTSFQKEPFISLKKETGKVLPTDEDHMKPDLVVLELENPFKATKEVRPACLPIKPIDPDSLCYISGKVFENLFPTPLKLYTRYFSENNPR